jgi:hypothetical protein
VRPQPRRDPQLAQAEPRHPFVPEADHRDRPDLHLLVGLVDQLEVAGAHRRHAAEDEGTFTEPPPFAG